MTYNFVGHNCGGGGHSPQCLIPCTVEPSIVQRADSLGMAGCLG